MRSAYLLFSRIPLSFLFTSFSTLFLSLANRTTGGGDLYQKHHYKFLNSKHKSDPHTLGRAVCEMPLGACPLRRVARVGPAWATSALQL